MSTITPVELSPLYTNYIDGEDHQPSPNYTAGSLVMTQKKLSINIKVMILFFALSCILQGYMPYTSYYSFLDNKVYFIPNLLNFIYIYLIFSYGLLSIKSVKRLVGIFVIIQPFMFMTEVASNFVLNKINIDILHPIFKLLLALWFIFLADTFLPCKNVIAKDFRNKFWIIIKALFITVFAGLMVILVKSAVNYLSVAAFDITGSYYVIPCFEIINYTIQLVIFFLSVFLISGILNKGSLDVNDVKSEVHGQQQKRNTKLDYLVSCVVIVLILSSTSYYLVFYGNRFLKYLQLISNTFKYS